MNTIYFPVDKFYKTLEGKALVGKVEFVDPTTTTLLDTYTFNKDGEYIAYTNPCYTGVYGNLDKDVFVMNQQTLVKAYSYIGDQEMSGDQDPNHWVLEWTCFKFFNTDNSVEEDNNVIGINGLRNADTTLKVVNVTGYWGESDCQTRQYFWDENASDQEDGGYVVKSANNNSGRWILMWNQEALPSEIYGVTTSNYTNLSNLLQYSNSVGSNSINTCRCIEFTNFRLPQTYAYTLTTSKKVICSCDCYFGKGTFSVNDVDVIGAKDNQYTSPIADFYINNNSNGTKVLASWFVSINGFFHSNARHLVYDYNPSGDRNKLTGECYLSNCTLEYTHDTHTAFNAQLTLDGVDLVMNPSFYFGAENTKKLRLKNIKVDTNNFRKLNVSQCTNCEIVVNGTYEDETDKVLYYDVDGKTSNTIRINAGGFIVNNENWDTTKSHTLDLAWISGALPDKCLWSDIVAHGTFKYTWLRMNNINKIDLTDVSVLDMNGYTDSTYNHKVSQDLIIKDLNVGKLMLQVTANSYKTTTFENCVVGNFYLRNTYRWTNLVLKDSKFTIGATSSTWICNSLVMRDSSMFDTREWEDESEPHDFEINELDGSHSYFEFSLHTFIGSLNWNNGGWGQYENAIVTKPRIYIRNDVVFNNNSVDNVHLFPIGDKDTKSHYQINNNMFTNGEINLYTENAYNSDGVISGNSGVVITIDMDYFTPGSHRITNNLAEKRSTDFKYNSFLWAYGVLAPSRYTQTFNYEKNGDESYAQTIYSWVTKYYFVPLKNEGETYLQWFNRVKDSAKLSIGFRLITMLDKEHIPGTSTWGTSTDSKFVFCQRYEVYQK